MSAPAAGGASTSEGVARSSALAFLAQEHRQSLGAGGQLGQADGPSGMATAPEALVPAGVQALLDACSAIYPNQPNPLQVTTRVKYWLGGQDPLDYISMYWNPGNEELRVPSHWHYISFGLSDLHGDGRVHPRPATSPLAQTASATSPTASPSPMAGLAGPMAQLAGPMAQLAGPMAGSPSGRGIELTFRLAATSPVNAPLWPAAMMQALARYIHATGNNIVAGDHIRGVSLGDLNLRHLLAARDPQLSHLTTKHGDVTFTQLVACTGRELLAAQRGDPHQVLAALASDTLHGCSPYLVSLSSRGSALPPSPPSPPPPPPRAPAALAAVTAPVLLLTLTLTPHDIDISMSAESSVGASETEHTVAPLTRTREALSHSHSHSVEGGLRMSTDSFEMSSIQRALPDLADHAEAVGLLGRVRFLPAAHVLFSRDAAAMLPLAIDGRVRCGSHFTFWWSCRVTLVGRDVTHAMCRDAPRHLAMAQHWLQIYIPDELAADMSQKFAKFGRLADSEDSASESEDSPRNESDRDSCLKPEQKTPKCDKDGSIGVSGRSKRDDRISLPCTFNWPEYNLSFSVVDDLYPSDFNML